MKNVTKTIIAVVAVTLAFAACKKKDDATIEGSWRITAATFNPPITISGTTYSDAYPMLFDEPCSQDNIFTFKDNGQVIEDEGALKCDTADVQTSYASYVLNGSNLTIYSDDTTTFTNVSVDEDHLKGTLTSDVFGTQANIVITWARQ